ncbi:hypothetical protein ABDK00_010110 [Niabella insulamsoli]|uniref:hypothetical protein n=1 Tax=Niabella insulamsoli TaxID=3144874 RepID=UPI0031FC0A2F
MATETLTVRRVPFYLFLVLVGFFIFYIYDKVKSGRDEEGPNYVYLPTKAGLIPEKKAKAFMKNYIADQRSLDTTYRLVTGENDDELLRGFWISIGTLHSMDSTIMKKNPKAKIAGYDIRFGKADANLDKRAYTIILRGTVLKEKNTSDEGNTVAYKAVMGNDLEESGDYADMTEPCPDNCNNDDGGVPVP